MGGKPRRSPAGLTLAELRAIALELPGAHEEPHFERTSFRVGKRIFATATADGREAMVPVKPPERAEAMIEAAPEVFFSYGTWTTRNGSLGIRLAAIDPALARDLVLEAYQRLAPKRS